MDTRTYALNPETFKLHIRGTTCPQSNRKSFIEFKTENEVVKKYGRKVSYCERCYNAKTETKWKDY